jgi:hypothetical protein
MRTLLLHFALLTALAAALLTGCAKKGYDYSTAPSYGYAESEADYYYEDDAEDMGGSGWGSRAAASEPMAPPMMARATAAPEAAEPEPDAAPAQQAARMVHYNGYVLLRATRPEEVVAEAVAMAEAMGGYVERRTLSSATLRVPVVEFKAAFDGLAELGDVLDKSMTAQDVTEAFTSVALRLKTARETRARLQELLARAVDEAEKLALLQEIQPLSSGPGGCRTTPRGTPTSGWRPSRSGWRRSLRRSPPPAWATTRCSGWWSRARRRIPTATWWRCAPRAAGSRWWRSTTPAPSRRSATTPRWSPR